EYVNQAEQLAIDRAKQIFGAEHANVQPHSGAQANMAVYLATLKPGDTVLGMSLAHGGHLTHGHPLNFSGLTYKFVAYGVTKETETIDYDELARLADEHKPKMVVVGASAYSRVIDFKRMGEIARSVGAMLFVDMAHIAGLIAAGIHPNPVPHADIVTTTTHKTLRGPRGGMILCREKYAKDIDRALFPGVQGGPLMHIIAAKAVCFKEALEPSFHEYQKQVVANAKALAASVSKHGYSIAQPAFDRAGITINNNSIPSDPLPPMKAGGIRVGTPAVTTRGMKEGGMEIIGGWIAEMLKNLGDAATEQRIRKQVEALASKFPLYTKRLEGGKASSAGSTAD